MLACMASTSGGGERPGQWVRPGEPGWPSEPQWAALGKAVGGRLLRVESPFTDQAAEAGNPFFQDLRNPFFIGGSPALTQTLGWTGAWTSRPSAYAVLAASSADVVAAVNFAREHRVRLVVKGGGHSYLGGSNAADSLLIWTRGIRDVQLHDRFVPQGAAGQAEPQTAVSVGAGALWVDVYRAVTTLGGRYVQGGGCTTVGVAGLVQGGGFGSFSKGFGTAGANLLEAEVVTADGTIRVASAASDPDLFWALKGGGGGTFGVVTRLTLRTHELPSFLGGLFASVTATSPAAYLALVEWVISFCRESLMSPHWGEQLRFGPGHQLSVSMVFQGLDQAAAERTWSPLADWIAARPADYTLSGPVVLAVPGRDFWNPAVLGSVPGLIVANDLPGAPAGQFHWANDGEQVGQVLHAFESAWLSRRLLDPGRSRDLATALVQASAARTVSLHCNKGLAGAPADALARTADTPMNPAVLDAFALAIVSASEPPAYPGIPGHEPDLAQGQRDAEAVAAAIAPLTALAGPPAAYVSEASYFQADWPESFWGDHYPRLAAVKDRYDPGGLFRVHHGVGS